MVNGEYSLFFILKCIHIPIEIFSLFLYSVYHSLERKCRRRKMEERWRSHEKQKNSDLTR